MKNLFRKFVNKVLLPHSQLTYSQAGEDIIMARLFYNLGIEKPAYLDIGANHPFYISNTYYFYLRGSKGVCIEPNPVLYEYFKKSRKRDLVLNIGIGENDQKEADFYLFPRSAHGLSTFSREEALYWKEVGMEKVGKISYEKIIKIPLQNINNIMKYFEGGVPDLISIDVEGLDLPILQSLDFSLYSPRVFCVETLGYDKERKEFKRDEIAQFLISRGYEVYADTRINTIFTRNS